MNVNAVWLTVNRRCNFRCEWCYAKGSKYCAKEEMTLKFAMELARISLEVGANKLILLGGETTLWKPLPEFIREMNKLNPKLAPTIITNGALFSSKVFRKKFAGLNYRVGISLKAGNEEQHRQLTGTTSFDQVKKAIRALSDDDQLCGISITVNNRIINNLEEMVKVIYDSGSRAVSFEMCAPSFDPEGNSTGEFLVHPKNLATTIAEIHPRLDEMMNGKVFFQISAPFCLFPDGFIEMIKKRGQMISGCHVFRRDGIIFDPRGAILLCNCLYHLPIGHWGEDFHDSHSLKEWWETDEVKRLNNRLLNYPGIQCSTCADYQHCGGGCCLQWFYFNPTQILK
jgi:radical SAM protein with 4Fe4S-binding SPASM domain